MLRVRHCLLLGLSLLLAACQLDVVITGNGAGRVQSADAKINCSNLDTACSARYSLTQRAVLTATPAANARFAGWSGACAGEEPTCELAMGQVHEVFAHFESVLPEQLACGTPAARAACLSPTFPPEYYVEQSIKYFRTMESSVDVRVQPNYSVMVARWEWRPWLLLTGLGNANLILTDILLKLNPTRYSSMECRAFPVQPFGRCHVVFDYSGHPCPIYEEFTFNDQGEMTFIEAWTDYPGLLPMPPADVWAEGENVNRLATRVPGLGTPTGLIQLQSEEMAAAAAEDADVADFWRRAKRPYTEYFKELATHAAQTANGCNAPVGGNIH